MCGRERSGVFLSEELSVKMLNDRKREQEREGGREREERDVTGCVL